jgi:hypothetical protein
MHAAGRCQEEAAVHAPTLLASPQASLSPGCQREVDVVIMF